MVNTLVRDGFVERKPDGADRRVVRLYITDAGRAVITYYVSQASAWSGMGPSLWDLEHLPAVIVRNCVSPDT